MPARDPRFQRATLRKAGGLASLEAEVRRDLERLNYPPKAWSLEKIGPDGKPMLDVLVVGGGMYGQTVTFALHREGIRNIRVIDEAAYGEEGPWGTFARMEILRSPKHQIGPDLGVPSLTFRSWLEAQCGEESWADLYKIHRLDWLAYLLWVRKVLALPIENRCALVSLAPVGDLLCAELRSEAGAETVFAREVVLATGREGAGERHVPSFPSLPHATMSAVNDFYHTSDSIDFAGLRGKCIAVLGANASAFDNAAVALESGAGAVSMFCRRPFLPQVNKARWMGFSGFQHGFPALDDVARWDLAKYTAAMQMPPPHESVHRCLAHANFSLHFGEPWSDVRLGEDGIDVVTLRREQTFDAVIFGTGFSADLRQRPELSAFRDHIMWWSDRVPADDAERYPQIAQFPYLGVDYQLLERREGSCPALGHVRLVSYAAAMSHGALAGDVPGLGLASITIAQAISRSLFIADFAQHRQRMMDFDEPELEPTPFFVPKEKRAPVR